MDKFRARPGASRLLISDPPHHRTGQIWRRASPLHRVSDAPGRCSPHLVHNLDASWYLMRDQHFDVKPAVCAALCSCPGRHALHGVTCWSAMLTVRDARLSTGFGTRSVHACVCRRKPVTVVSTISGQLRAAVQCSAYAATPRADTRLVRPNRELNRRDPCTSKQTFPPSTLLCQISVVIIILLRQRFSCFSDSNLVDSSMPLLCRRYTMTIRCLKATETI